MILRDVLDWVLQREAPNREMEALVVVCCWLHGFMPRYIKLEMWQIDTAEWINEYGPPTREKLLAWVNALGLEAEIPAPAVERNLRSICVSGSLD